MRGQCAAKTNKDCAYEVLAPLGSPPAARFGVQGCAICDGAAGFVMLRMKNTAGGFREGTRRPFLRYLCIAGTASMSVRKLESEINWRGQTAAQRPQETHLS